MSKRWIFVALVLVVGLGGCTGGAGSAAAPPGNPTAAAATVVVTPAPSPTRAATALPTATEAAAATATPPVPGAAATVDVEAPVIHGGSGMGTEGGTPAAAVSPAGQGAEATPAPAAGATGTPPPPEQHPMSIVFERQRAYPGSEITFEQTLEPGANYSRYIVSYRSDGFRIYALMTVPVGEKPQTGWPVVLFYHGYIPPKQYVTTERYVAYVDAFARAGYIVFKSDYRGHGNSEGQAAGSGEGSPDYTTDVLNALASLKRYPDADPDRIGSWGHSMGGQVTLRAMVVSKDIKAGVIWAGVVCSYGDMLTLWNHPPGANRRGWRPEFIAQYGTPEQNPAFWAAISPNSYLADLSGPVQLHHGTADEEVPTVLSERLKGEIQAAGKPVEMFTYPGDNHNISANFSLAMQRSVAFMDKHVKGN